MKKGHKAIHIVRIFMLYMSIKMCLSLGMVCMPLIPGTQAGGFLSVKASLDSQDSVTHTLSQKLKQDKK